MDEFIKKIFENPSASLLYLMLSALGIYVNNKFYLKPRFDKRPTFKEINIEVKKFETSIIDVEKNIESKFSKIMEKINEVNMHLAAAGVIKPANFIGDNNL